MAQHYLTQAGYDNMVAELEKLKNEELPVILVKLKNAIEQGDLSENAEYEQAMEDKSMTESRIAELKDFLANVEIIEGATLDTVGYGNKVEIEIDGVKQEYEVVGSGEVDVFSNKISLHSPLGSAIKDKKVGDTVIVESPKGEYKVKILSIL